MPGARLRAVRGSDRYGSDRDGSDRYGSDRYGSDRDGSDRYGSDRDISDRGAAVVDFVMMSVLLVFLLFAVLQVAVYFYARNIVAASAADAARYAANAGVDSAAGGPRASELIRQGLGSNAASRVRCQGGTAVDADSGLAVARVHCRGRLKLIFLPLDLPMRIDVTSSSLKEGTP